MGDTPDLFGGALEQTKKPRKRKAAGEANPAVARCIDHYDAEFQRRHGFKPDRRGYGRFGKDLRDLLETWTEQNVLDMMEDFFYDNDPRVLRGNWSTADFANLAQYLRIKRTSGAPILDARTANNLDAARRATQRR